MSLRVCAMNQLAHGIMTVFSSRRYAKNEWTHAIKRTHTPMEIAFFGEDGSENSVVFNSESLRQAWQSKLCERYSKKLCAALFRSLSLLFDLQCVCKHAACTWPALTGSIASNDKILRTHHRTANRWRKKNLESRKIHINLHTALSA